MGANLIRLNSPRNDDLDSSPSQLEVERHLHPLIDRTAAHRCRHELEIRKGAPDGREEALVHPPFLARQPEPAARQYLPDRRIDGSSSAVDDEAENDRT